MSQSNRGIKLFPHQEVAVKYLQENGPKVVLDVPSRISPDLVDAWTAAIKDPSTPKIIVDSCNPELGGDRQLLATLNYQAQQQARTKIINSGRRGKSILSRRLIEEHGMKVLEMDRRTEAVEAEKEQSHRVTARRRVGPTQTLSAMLTASLGMRAGTGVDLSNPFAALEQRTLTPAEAAEAFKTTDGDRDRMSKAEAKRARKAAKLARQGD